MGLKAAEHILHAVKLKTSATAEASLLVKASPELIVRSSTAVRQSKKKGKAS
jgi:hypothetical protein